MRKAAATRVLALFRFFFFSVAYTSMIRVLVYKGWRPHRSSR